MVITEKKFNADAFMEEVEKFGKNPSYKEYGRIKDYLSNEWNAAIERARLAINASNDMRDLKVVDALLEDVELCKQLNTKFVELGVALGVHGMPV